MSAQQATLTLAWLSTAALLVLILVVWAKALGWL